MPIRQSASRCRRARPSLLERGARTDSPARITRCPFPLLRRSRCASTRRVRARPRARGVPHGPGSGMHKIRSVVRDRAKPGSRTSMDSPWRITPDCWRSNTMLVRSAGKHRMRRCASIIATSRARCAAFSVTNATPGSACTRTIPTSCGRRRPISRGRAPVSDTADAYARRTSSDT
jgi:hypothetical protein